MHNIYTANYMYYGLWNAHVAKFLRLTGEEMAISRRSWLLTTDTCKEFQMLTLEMLLQFWG